MAKRLYHNIKKRIITLKNIEIRTAILLRNIIIASGGRVLNLCSNLFIVYFALNALGKDAYASLAVMMSITIFFTYADFGLASTLVNSLADADRAGDHKEARVLVAQIWIFLWMVALTIGAIAVLSYLAGFEFFSNYFPTRDAGLAFAIFVGSTLCAVPLGIDQRIYFSMQRGDLAQIWMLVSRLSVVLSAALAYKYSQNLVSFTIALATVPAIISAFSCIYVFRRLRPELNPMFIPSFAGFSTLISTGALFALLSISNFLEIGIDPVFFRSIFGSLTTADNDILTKLLTYIPALANLAVTPLWPAMAAARAAGDYRWIVNANKITAITLIIVAGSLLSIIAINLDLILHAWLGENAPKVLPQQTAAFIFIFLQTYGVYQLFTMNALNLIKKSALIALAVPLLILPLKIIVTAQTGDIVDAYIILIVWYVIKISICQYVIQSRLNKLVQSV